MNEAKQKAQELVDKFYEVKNEYEETHANFIDVGLSYEAAKQCALICCDEMIKTSNEARWDSTDLWNKNNEFLKSVKTEINKL